MMWEHRLVSDQRNTDVMATHFEAPLADIDYLVAAQMQEMEMVRQKVYTLEQTQVAIKNR